MPKPLQQLIDESYSNASDGEGPFNCSMFYHKLTGEILSLSAKVPVEFGNFLGHIQDHPSVGFTYLVYNSMPVAMLAYPKEEVETSNPGLQIALQNLENHYQNR